MFENIRLSFQGIWSHKMRSFLTMLGIIIGIASIISIVSTIKGTNDEIKNNLIGAGNNTVQIKLEENGFEYSVSDGTELPFGVPEDTYNPFDRYCDISKDIRQSGRGCTAWVLSKENMNYLHKKRS